MKLRLEKLQAEMDRNGWTKADLADHMGCRPQWVHQIFANQFSHTLRTIERIASAFKPPLDPKDLIE